MTWKRSNFEEQSAEAKPLKVMIKPIAYHDIREKKKLEAKLFSKLPLEKRKAISREFIDLFSKLRNQNCDPEQIGVNPITQK